MLVPTSSRSLQQKYPGKLLEPVKGNPFKWRCGGRTTSKSSRKRNEEVFTDSDNRWTLICKLSK